MRLPWLLALIGSVLFLIAAAPLVGDEETRREWESIGVVRLVRRKIERRPDGVIRYYSEPHPKGISAVVAERSDGTTATLGWYAPEEFCNTPWGVVIGDPGRPRIAGVSYSWEEEAFGQLEYHWHNIEVRQSERPIDNLAAAVAAQRGGWELAR